MKAGYFYLLLAAFALLFFTGLADRPLFTPDEGRYAEIAREMVARNDYITPYLNGIKYFEKPVLFYWLGALAIHLGGVKIAAVRTVNAMLGLLGVLMIYATGRRLYNPATGVLAACVLATSMLYFVMAHMVSLDLPVTVFLMGCLFNCLFAIKNPSQHRYFYLAAIFSALAVLTKGLIGVVFPAMILGAWLLITSEWRLLSRLPVLRALCLFLLIAVPWHVLVNHYNPEFFHFYFVEQHFLRYTNPEIGHYQPAWFFIPVLCAGFFPWIVFLPQTLRSSTRNELFLLLWAGLVFVFFSFSKSKLIPYILPVIPPLALLTGRYLDLAISRPRKTGLYAGTLALVTLAAVMTYYLGYLTIPMSHPSLAMLYLYAASSCLLAGSIISLFLIKKHTRAALAAIIIGSATFITLSYHAVQYIDTRTVRPLAETITPLLQDQDIIITYNQYFQDLPFYTQRQISILNWQNELTFGMQHQETPWMINDAQFFKLWRSKTRIYMIMSKQEFALFKKQHPRDKIILMDQTINNVLVTNIPI